jgi:1-deoxy-D-xylulose-5-phosphate reductoisomerase
MKKKIIILGSTGSIGLQTINIFKKDKKNFDFLALSTFSNVNKILEQAKDLKVKNLIINDKNKFNLVKLKNKNNNLNIYNSFDDLEKIINKKKIYYSMVSVSGLDGLKPTIILSKYTNNLAIVNKESLICGWDLIKKNLIKYKSNFIPIDSEHYSIHSIVKGHNNSEIEKIYITASGGPFLNYPKNKFKFIKPKNALNHPNWKMGKKISIDSATLMNKVFEVIEARNIFNINYDKISILTHRKSYLHAIVKFKSGFTQFLVHEPDMKIPIHNSIYNNMCTNYVKSKSLNFDIINNLDLRKVNTNKFPTIKLLNNLPAYNSLFETVLLTINDYFVNKFLLNQINFNQLINSIIKISNLAIFKKYKKIKPKNVNQIYKLRDYVSLKIKNLGI